MQLTILGAMILAAAGAFFGVVGARGFWAEDLKRAERIDAIRSRTEDHLREQIDALEKQISILRRRDQ